jgi:hypothetical protein
VNRGPGISASRSRRESHFLQIDFVGGWVCDWWGELEKLGRAKPGGCSSVGQNLPNIVVWFKYIIYTTIVLQPKCDSLIRTSIRTRKSLIRTTIQGQLE